jgi:peptide/nickel transport system permease protein/oligopeptide transport system permease protein
MAGSADLWVPRVLGDPVAIDTTKVVAQSLKSPSFRHPFGTDTLGRDIASRIIYGARVSLVVGVLSVAIMVALGLLLGGLAGYLGGAVDALIMRLADVVYSFPYVLFAIALIAVLGKGFQNVFIAIGLLGWPSIARVFRSSVLGAKGTEYVEAARGLGASWWRILVRHILPNTAGPVIVYGAMSVGGAILAESALSFLGMGVQPPSPSWGGMLSESRSYLFTAPWLMLYPGIALLLTVLAFLLLGDALRDALDVKGKRS